MADIFDSVIFGGGAILDDSGYLQEESFKYDLGKYSLNWHYHL